MQNCHNDMLKYHNHEVTLPQPEQDEMRARRDTNRDRLKAGLKRNSEPAPKAFQSQGSYAHRTMVQHPDKDYDIDDGVCFNLEELKGSRGGDKTPHDAKEMVRAALHNETFKEPPEVRTNCVRIHYNEGYHMDVPVYREIVEDDWPGEPKVHWEIAGADWKLSDPKGVTSWFQEENKSQSPDAENGRQLRRIVRLIKAFARSRQSWKDHIASGFMISVLVVECYRANEDREDHALYETLAAIRDRLQWDLVVEHPAVEGEYLTKDSDDTKARFLREKLDWAMDKLNVLSDFNCTRKQALEAWDKVFNTSFFANQLAEGDVTAASSAGAAAGGILVEDSRPPSRPVDKRGGGRYA